MNYSVTVGTDILEYSDRKQAIAEAKDRSRNHRGEVIVADSQGAEVLTYRAGELSSYLWDDRK